MSHLDVPRIHFSGTFTTDPSTSNNARGNYAAARGGPVRDQWNPDGRHHFNISATVGRVLDASGAAFSSSAGDGAVGASVRTSGPGRLVDLDPDCQTFSQIWGLTVQVTLTGAPAASLQGVMDTATLRDLWPLRSSSGDLGDMGGVYQSVLRGVTFTGARTGAFDGLRAATAGGVLAIKFVLWGYDTGPKSGNVVGTIGPFTAADDQLHFVGARRMEGSTSGTVFFMARAAGVATPSGPPPPYMSTPFKVDAARQKIIIDMGNTLPDADRVGSRLGRMHAAVRGTGGVLTYLGARRMTYDTAHYMETAGVEEVDLTAADVRLVQANPLLLKVEDPRARVILTERPSGRYVDATQLIVRLDPGATERIELVAREFGSPKSGQALALFLLGTGGAAPAAAAALSFPSSVTTGANGRAAVTFTAVAAGAGNPRGALDGQYYLVGFYWGAIAPSNLRGIINVRVYDAFTAPAVPAWADVQGLFTEYANLYPSMRNTCDMSDRTMVESWAAMLAASLRRSITAPNFMPVTRDLSQAKRNAMLSYLDNVVRRAGP
jgi:hypothetical protein